MIDKHKAFRLRRKAGAGKKLTPQQSRELKEYDGQAKKGPARRRKPAAARAKPDPEASTIGAEDLLDDARPARAAEPPPLFGDDEPRPSQPPADEQPPGEAGGDGDDDVVAELVDEVPGDAGRIPDDVRWQMAEALAKRGAGWLKKWNQWLASRGWLEFPEWMIEEFWVPAATQKAYRDVIPTHKGAGQDMENVALALPLGYMFLGTGYTAWKLRKSAAPVDEPDETDDDEPVDAPATPERTTTDAPESKAIVPRRRYF